MSDNNNQPNDEDHPKTPLDIAFDAYCDLWFSGRRPNPKEFCKNHPEIESALFQKIEDFLYVADRHEAITGNTPAGSKSTIQKNNPKTDTVIGDFKIIQEIGKGGMGAVFEAEQVSMKRKIALKVLPPHLSLSTDAVMKFQREAEAGGRQKHEGLVVIYDVGEQDGVHFIAQELVGDGATLQDSLTKIRKSKEQPPGYFRVVAKQVTEVANALQHAHDTGVIHRDIKPSNILVTNEGKLKVTDFGLAKIEDALALSRTGDFAGTPYYMSPEQAASRRIGIDHRTDIFSLGVTLYEMLTLVRPFDGDTSQEVLKKVLLHEPNDPRKVNPNTPKDLSVICLKAIEKKPEDRYETMKDFAEDLGRFLSGDVILAKPASLASRVWRRLKRNSALSLAIAVAMISIISLIFYLPYSYFKMAKDKERATQAEKRAVKSMMAAKKAEKEAIRERDEKERQLLVSEGLRLSSQSKAVLSINPTLSLLLAIEGAKRHPGVIANNALLCALDKCNELKMMMHGERVHAVRFSPDGKYVASGSLDKTVKLWDAETGELIWTFQGHTWSVNCLMFSPDGLLLASASFQDPVVHVWDIRKGKKAFSLKGHAAGFYELEFTPNGEKILTGSSDSTIGVWDTSTGSQYLRFSNHEKGIISIDISYDGKRAISGSEDKTARIWDIETGEELVILDQHTDMVREVYFINDGKSTVTRSRFAYLSDATTGEVIHAFKGNRYSMKSLDISPDNKILATASEYVIDVWDLQAGKRLYSLEHRNLVAQVMFSPNGKLIFSISEDMTGKLWETSSGEFVANLIGHREGLEQCDFSPDGKIVATGARDGTVRIWSVNGNRLIKVLKGQKKALEYASYSGDGKWILTGSQDGKAKLWCAESYKVNHVFQHGQSFVAGAIFSEDNAQALTFFGKTANLWDLSTGKEVSRFEGHQRRIKTAAISPDLTRVITGSLDTSVRVWDAKSGDLMFLLISGLGSVSQVLFSPDGKKAVTITGDDAIRIWNSENGEEILKIIDRDVIGIAFSEKGEKLITWGNSFTTGKYGKKDSKIFDVNTGREIVAFIGHEDTVCIAAFSPNDKLAATGSMDGTARIWNAETGEQLNVLRGHEGGIICLNFTPDGSKLITGGKDGTARIWDTITGEENITLSSHIGEVVSVCFSPDGKEALTASHDGTARVWIFGSLMQKACQLKPRDLSPLEKHKYNIR